MEKSVGDDIKVMVHNKNTNDILATGGQENDLKLWQLKNMDKPIFTAKNVISILLLQPVMSMDLPFCWLFNVDLTL